MSHSKITNEITNEIVGRKRFRAVENMPPELTALCERRRKARLDFLNEPNSNAVK